MKLRSASKDVAVEQAVYVKTSRKNISEFTPEFFEDSSRAWKSNKVEVAKGIYKYKKEEVLIPRRSTRLQTKDVSVGETVLRRSSRLASKEF